MLSPDVFKAILSRAKHHALPVTGHVPLSMIVIQAARAGLSNMEHMRNLQMDCSTQERELFAQRQELLLSQNSKLGSKLRSEIHTTQHFPAVQSYDAEQCGKLLKQLAKYDTWQIPTMTLNMLFKTPYYGDPEWQKTYQTLPAYVAASWLERSIKIAQRLAAPSERQNQRLQVTEWQTKMLKQIVDANIPVMAGTDTPIFYLTPGFSLHPELQTLVEAGMTPMKVLESSTLAPAKYFGLENTQGSISKGMLADLVLLDADPLMDIRNSTKIVAVIKTGEFVDRSRLDELLDPT